MCESTQAKAKFTANAEREVLPTNVRPSHYVLTLTPDLNNFTFQGHAQIKIKVNEATSKIVLNSNEIEIQKAQIKNLQGKTEQSFDSESISYDEKTTTATISFAQELEAETETELHLEFTGILNDKMNGFYRSSYDDENGNKRYMATTQFEPADARKAFPCWDEPSIKATFDITLRVPSNLVALSNMNAISDEPISGTELKEVKFATTPIMSTYLLAFIVGDLEYIESHTEGKVSGTPVKCRVYTLPGKSSQGRFALDVCTKTLDLFDEVFGTPYPLPKMDMVAIPDFDAGAMENWGLVTYRTVLLLFDEATTSNSTKQRIASVVAHELAHQWFGNLVTMEWWSDLWLNEGFATWVGNYAVDKLFPEWDFWTQFVSDDFERGLELDAMRSSHPIEVDVKNAFEINQIFDAISYSKGASVIRMLNAYLTEDVFLSGIRSYLKKHKYSNAGTNDLWKALSDESGQDVSKFMNLWTRQVGYPYLAITEEDASESEKTLLIRQNRYLSSGDTTAQENESTWWVPLGLATEASGLKPSHDTLTEKEIRVNVPKNGFYKLNFDTTSVYRVHYPRSALTALGELISKKDVLSPRDRINIISDAGALGQSGIGSSADFLELLQYYVNEDNYSVWTQLASRLASLVSVWFEEKEEIRNQLKALRVKTFSQLVKKLGWESTKGEGDLVGLLRALAISNVGLSGGQEVVSEAKRRFDLFIKGDQSAIQPDLRGPVFNIVVSEGGQEEFQAIKKLYIETDAPDQKLSALRALGYTRNPELISEALNYGISDQVRNQDIIYIFSSLGANTASRRASWSFIKSHWGVLEERYSTNFAILGNLLKYTAGKLSSEKDAEEVESFFNGKDTKKVQRPLQQTLESIRSSAQWLSRDNAKVSEWLSKH
ncbi:hypothetical protein K502DRAFT_326607 [Neoconidiobolus thromboides FSU 785]|nr:hypothetical protein K502DRAFT_326607 [Neoconidiobolus thromboides FSU 785]